MEATKEKLYSDISSVFANAIETVRTKDDCTLTDMYVCVKYDDLLVVIYDDSENILLQETIDGWDDLKENSENFDSIKQKFESLDFVGPFSVILIDDNFEQICELVTYDKDMIYLEDDFLDKMDKELDEFFEKLMSDVE